MKQLKNYLTESVKLQKTGFKEVIPLNTVGEFFRNKFPKHFEVIQQLAKDIFAGIDNPRILKSETQGFLKIPYEVADILDQMTLPEIFTLIKNGDKRFIKIGNKKVFETGKGSAEHDISAVIHENLTCLYFNNRDNWGTIGDKKELPTGLAYQLMIESNISKLWVKSFMEQCKALDDYLTGELGIDPKSLKAVRIDTNLNNRNMIYDDIYGEGSTGRLGLLSSDGVAIEKYNEIIDKFKRDNIKITKRENIDKSDILLYNPNKIGNIDVENITLLKLRELFHNGILIGVSLKQLNKINGIYEIDPYNLNDVKKNILKTYEILPFVSNNGEVKNQVDIKITTLTNVEYILTYRSFGSKNYMDIHTVRTASYGKTPVRLWRESLDSENIGQDFKKYFEENFADFNRKFGWGLEADEIELTFNPNNATKDCIKLLTLLYKKPDEKIRLDLQSWMSGALSEGDDMLPFLLTAPK